MAAILAPLHLLSFSTLLGSQLYQTFIVTKVAFKRLPRNPYVNFQKHIFPIFFQGQALLLFLTAVTLPPYGPLSLIEHKSDWVPFAVSGIISGLNVMIFGPRTRKLMLDRVEQGKLYFFVSGWTNADASRYRRCESSKPRGTKYGDAGFEEEVCDVACYVYSLELDRSWGSSLVYMEIGVTH